MQKLTEVGDFFSDLSSISGFSYLINQLSFPRSEMKNQKGLFRVEHRNSRDYLRSYHEISFIIMPKNFQASMDEMIALTSAPAALLGEMNWWGHATMPH